MRRPGTGLAPSSRHARVRRVARDRVEIEIGQRAPGDESVARLRARAVVGERDRRRGTGRAARVRFDTRASSRARPRPARRRSSRTRRCGCAGRRPSSRAPARARCAPSLRSGPTRARRATGRGRAAAEPLTSAGDARPYHSSGSPKPGVVARFLQRLVDDIGRERAGPREALALTGDDADADAFDARRRQRLDLAVEHLDVGVARAHHVRLDLFTVARGARDVAGDVDQVALDSRRRSRRRSFPARAPSVAPTTPARSDPACRTCRSRSRSRCRPRRPCAARRVRCRSTARRGSGRVISPFSMRYASVIPNTKSPVAGIDLTAAELHRVDTEVDAANDVVGIGLAFEQERVRHARHRQVAVASRAVRCRSAPVLLCGRARHPTCSR